MFAALGSLCNLFAGKCSRNIQVGANANQYILTHSSPPGSVRTVTGGTPLPKPNLSPQVISFNELFWCGLSMVMNILMSVMLQLVMFLKVATFLGKPSEVALV